MLSHTASKLLIALAITLCLSSTARVANGQAPVSVCANWLNSLSTGSGSKVTVRMLKRQNNEPFQLLGANAGRKTTYLTPGTGTCGIPYTDETHGACLWGGRNTNAQVPPNQKPGWLNGAFLDNCGKKFVIRRGSNQAQGTFVDNCSFADGDLLTIEQGCSSIYVTLATFVQLGGDPAKEGRIEIDSWNFDASTPPV